MHFVNTIKQDDQIMTICAYYLLQTPQPYLASQVCQAFLGGHVIALNCSAFFES